MATAVASDVGMSPANAPKPTVTLGDAVRATAAEEKAPTDPKADNVPHANLKDGKAGH
jgi:hypothetical protein